MDPFANLTEVFSSFQGEGPYTGEPTTFVRFSGCGVGCQWCDTAGAECPTFRVESPPGSCEFARHPNPVTPELLNHHLVSFTDPWVSLTGGEPLGQFDFLTAWLPTVRPWKKVLLETNGIFPKAMEAVANDVDVISMDIKLPSSTGTRGYWQEHAAFLSAALSKGKEVYIKIVVTSKTNSKDIQDAIKLISSANKYLPIIIQPASDTDKFHDSLSEDELSSIVRVCQAWLPNVKMMGQMHKRWGVL